MTVALLILIAFAYAQFRHIGLALVAALAPLPGQAIVAALHMPAQPLAYLCGFIAALVLTAAIEARICDGIPAKEATAQVTPELLPTLAWSLALTVCATVVFAFATKNFAALWLSLAIVLCGVAALIFVPTGLRFLPYPQDFITRANRLRERRGRWLDALTFMIQPRWGWSIAGIALVFAVLGFFGGENSRATGASIAPAAWPIALSLFTVFAYVATRSIRRTIGFALTTAVLMCLMFWISAGVAIDPVAPASMIALASSPALILAEQSSAFARTGDTVAVATLRSLERCAVPTIFFCLAATPALCVSSEYAAAILVPCGVVTALLIFPALMTAIYDFFPPRVSLDAYRVR